MKIKPSSRQLRKQQATSALPKAQETETARHIPVSLMPVMGETEGDIIKELLWAQVGKGTAITGTHLSSPRIHFAPKSHSLLWQVYQMDRQGKL